jgi:hypothetical protein
MMPLLVQRNSVTGWYGPDQGSRSVILTRGPPVLKFTKTKQKWKKTHPARSSGNIAREAFKDAVEYFKKELTKEQFKEIDLQNSHSIEDVHKVVLDAKKIYDDSSSREKKGAEMSAELFVSDDVLRRGPRHASTAPPGVRCAGLGDGEIRLCGKDLL